MMDRRMAQPTMAETAAGAMAHEHPQPFSPLPIVDLRLLRELQRRLDSGTAEGGEAIAAIDELAANLAAVETAVRAARAIAFGTASTDLLHGALAAIASINITGPFGTSSPTTVDACGEAASLDAPSPTDWKPLFSRAPLLDLLAGLTYLREGDREGIHSDFDVVMRTLRPLCARIEAVILATQVPQGRPQDQLATNTLLALVGPVWSYSVPLTDLYLDAATAMATDWLERSPVLELLRECTGVDLNQALASIDPDRAWPGGTVELIPKDAWPGEARSDVAVFIEGSRAPADVLEWTRERIVVAVPEGATSGHVFFGPASDATTEVGELLAEWQKRYADEWESTIFPLLMRGGLRRPPYCDATAQNHLKVTYPTRVANAYLTDSCGMLIDNPVALARSKPPIELNWRCAYAMPDTRVRVKQGTRVLADSMGPSGSLIVGTATLDLAHDLRVEIASGRESAARKHGPRDASDTGMTLAISDWPFPQHVVLFPISGEPEALHLGVPTEFDGYDGLAAPEVPGVSSATLRLRFAHPPAGTAALTVESSSARVVVASQQIEVAAGSETAGVDVRALSYNRDAPGTPCATLDVTAISSNPAGGVVSYSGSVDVWVEPLQGKWELVGHPTGGDIETQAPGIPIKIEGDRTSIVAIHAILLEDGRELFFAPPTGSGVDAVSSEVNDQDKVDTELWNWVDRRSLGRDDPPPSDRNRNLFCAGHVHTADGRVLIAGGHSMYAQHSTDWFVHMYDPSQPVGRGWARLGEMQQPRWYPTLVMLPDERVLIVSGSAVGAYFYILGQYGGTIIWPFRYGWSASGGQGLFDAGSATAIDVWDPARGIVHFPGHFLDSNQDTYPYLSVMPAGPGASNGAVLAIERNRGHLFSFEPTATDSPVAFAHSYDAAFRSRRTYPTYGGGTLLPVDNLDPHRARYFIFGGGNETDPHLSPGSDATDTAEIFDYDATQPLDRQPAFRALPQRLSHRRFMSDAVLLPDGNVLICGGASRGLTNESSGPVLVTELFDSSAETLRDMDSANIVRRYHSTHMLLPDATVQATGSTGGFGTSDIHLERRVEIFRPPYLWRGRRPEMPSAPAGLHYGGSFTLTTPQAAEVAYAMLVKLAAVTHANNMDQRAVRLQIEAVHVAAPDHTSDTLVIAEPRDSTVAPPGPYMLFVVDRLGVPSNASIVRVR